MGRAQLRAPGGEVLELDRKAAGLLGYVALEGPTPRSTVAGLLWPDSGEEQARTNLRKLLLALRRVGPVVQGDAHLALAEGVRVDVNELLAAGRAAAATGPGDVAMGQGDVAPGLGASAPGQGIVPLLAGLVYDDCPDFADWLSVWRERLWERQLRDLEAEAQRLEEEGELGAALQAAVSLVFLEPLSEAGHRRVMRLHYLLGDRAAALAAYHRCQDVLQRELGVAPLPETAALAREIEREAVFVPPRSKRPIPLRVVRPPLVGRDEAWARLEAAWEAGRTVYVSGDAGVGKSRLLHDFAAGKGRFLATAARPGERAIPYATGVRLLRGLLEGESVEELEPWARLELSRVLPGLAEARPAPTPPEEEHRFYEAWALVFERWSRRADALVNDDLHNWDEASLRVATNLASRGGASPSRSLNAFRPAELPPSHRRLVDEQVRAGLAEVIEVAPLPPEAVAELSVRLELPDAPALAPQLHALTGGNPLYLVEALKSLYETDSFGADDLPERLGSVLVRRLEQLSSGAHQLAMAVAVAGELDLELAAAMLEVGPLELAGPVRELEEAHLLRDGSLSHDLVGEVLRQGMPAAVGRLLHQRAAALLEARGEALRAAEHWLEAGDAARAVQQWRSAARDMRERGLPHEAVSVLERALELARGRREAPELNLELAEMYFEVGRYADAEDRLEALPSGADGPRLRAVALKVRASLLRALGKVEEAKAAIAEGSRLAAHLDDEGLRVDFLGQRVEVAALEGSYEEALALLEEELARLRSAGPSARLAMVLSDVGVLYRLLGDLEASALYQQESRALAHELGATQQEYQATTNLASVDFSLGRYEEALDLTLAALDLGTFHGRDTVRGNLASLYLLLGRYEEAIAESEALAGDAAIRQERILAWARLAELYTLTGRKGEVAPALERALELCRKDASVVPRVRVIINCLKFGTAEQRARARAMLAELDPHAVPAGMREELASLPAD